jgi:hypothetical protein
MPPNALSSFPSDAELIDNLMMLGVEDEHKSSVDYRLEYLVNDSKADRFHDLYLQKHAFEFMMPILFEDGMDYVECELYYASITSQISYGGSILRRARNPQPRRATLEELREGSRQGVLLPCIRKSRLSKRQQPRSGPVIRRCSFSGMPQLDDVIPLTRSNSMEKLLNDEPRVAFEEYVSVVTIYPAEEYPEDIKSSIWMSREEMSNCMRRAMVEEMREQRERVREQREKSEELREKERQLEDYKHESDMGPLESGSMSVVDIPL